VNLARPLRLVVLISGDGSNLQAIIDRCADPEYRAEVVAVISNRPHAGGLARARRAGIAHETLEHTRYPNRERFDEALLQRVDRYRPDLVLLAGFMRILTPGFVRHHAGRLLNIHPSLLPAYPGLHTHRRVLEAGENFHGASVHFVTENLEGGPVVLQARVPVYDGDDEQMLAARVLAWEHRIYPQVIQWMIDGHLHFDPAHGAARLKQQSLPVVWC